MNIAIDCRMYGKTGIGVFLRGLLENLPNSNKYLLIGDLEKLRKYRTNKIEIYNVNISPFSISEYFLFPVNRINKYDYLICPNFNIPNGITIPIHTVIHDVLFLDMKYAAGSFLGYLIRKYFIFRALRISDKIYTVSKFSRNRIVERTGYKKGITVIYNGLSKSFLDKVLMDGRRKEKQKIPYCLYIGNLKRHKNLGTLVKAFILSKEIGYKGNLVLVGSFENLRTKDNNLQRIIDNVQYHNSIVIRERVSDEELFEIIMNADLLIQPSLYEGFGLPPLEAMYCGTSVALSNIPVFKELYSDFPVEMFEPMDVNGLSKIILQKRSNINVKEIDSLIDKLGYNFMDAIEKIVNNFI